MNDDDDLLARSPASTPTGVGNIASAPSVKRSSARTTDTLRYFPRQWKVLRGVHVDGLGQDLAGLSEAGWEVHSILGSLGNLAIVATRLKERG